MQVMPAVHVDAHTQEYAVMGRELVSSDMMLRAVLQ